MLNGSQILAEKWKIGSTEYLLIFLYDESGAPIGLKYRTSSYTAGNFNSFFFEKNLQGDIIAIYDETGSKIGSYIYDAWGNHTYSTTSGNTSLENRIVSTYNPFRYRGYFYDVETQWYYLQSRYYNPSWSRFLNADIVIGSGGFAGFNLFAYCANNPISFCDPCGNCPHQPYSDCPSCVGGIPTEDTPPVATYGPDGEIILDKEEFEEYIVNNCYEEYVLDTPGYAYYYGARVVKHDSDTLTSWQVFGTIYLNRNDLKEDSLRHEYGHYVQEQDLGSLKYLLFIALPSVISCGTDMIFNHLSSTEYHSLPWEYTANLFGRVSRTDYCKDAGVWGTAYYLIVKQWGNLW